MTTAEIAVSRGANILDRLEPDWHDRIVLDTFLMQDFTRCVIGQVFVVGDGELNVYNRHIADLLAREVADVTDSVITGQWFSWKTVAEFAVACGFNCCDDARGAVSYYCDLQDAWVEQIKARRAALVAA